MARYCRLQGVGDARRGVSGLTGYDIWAMIGTIRSISSTFC